MSDALTQLRTALADRYAVEQELGAGGMAVVYLARDLRHDRKVAIKVLRQDVGGASAERFLREIRTVAQLHHPHILQLLDSGRAGDHLFYVMPYVEGETIRQRLEREGPLPVEEAVRITREVADGLAFAHARGIVHRDIKPENIFLFAGHALVADFGIARAAESAAGSTTLTDAGLAVGTPTYMSPEQATAEPKIDGRSDQYALGCVLYEMLAGAPPFTGPTSQAIMARHTADPVPPLRTVRDVPVALESALNRALAKMPADRWPTMPEFADALLSPATTMPALAAAPSRSSRIRSPLAIGAALALIAIAAWQFAFDGKSSQAALPEDTLPSVAILPFKFSGDSNYKSLSDGLAEDLATELTRVGGIRVLGPQRTMRASDVSSDPSETGRALGVQTVFTARVRIAGNLLRVTPELINVASDSVVWTDLFDGELSENGKPLEYFTITDSLRSKIIGALRPNLTNATPLRRNRPVDVEALSLHHQARRLIWDLQQNTVEQAIVLLRRAIARDSSFADAWATLGWGIGLLGAWRSTPELQREAQHAVEHALELDSLNAMALVQRGWSLADNWRWEEAWRDFRTAARSEPGSADMAMPYGGFLRMVNEVDSGVAYQLRAVTYDPTNAVAWQSYGHLLAWAGKRDSAIMAMRRAVALDSLLWYAHSDLANLYLDSGRRDSADASIARALRFGTESYTFASVARYYRRIGNRDGAREMLAKLNSLAKVKPVSPAHVAIARMSAGDRVGALDKLEEAADRDKGQAAFMMLEAAADLANEPRFQALKQRIWGDRPLPHYPFR